MSTATLAPSGRVNVLSNTLTIARRNLLHIKANPEQLVEMSIQPLMFLVLFNPSIGLLSDLLPFDVLKNPGLLNDPDTALLAVAITTVWQNLGLQSAEQSSDPNVLVQGIQMVMTQFKSLLDENGVSEIRLRFQKPGGVNTGKLVVHAGNTAWSGYLNREFISLFGGSYETWRQQQEALKVTDPMKWQIEQSLPIKVFVRAGKEWKFIDYFIHTGNTASRDMIMQLDLRGIEGREVELKLEAAYRFWQVDRAAMDFTTESGITSNYLAMTSAEKAGGAQQLANLAADDNRYTILEQQEQVSLEFSATELEPESNSSLFLVSSGYYHVNSEFGGAAQLKELGAFRQAGHYDRFSRERYRRMDSLLSVARVNR